MAGWERDCNGRKTESCVLYGQLYQWYIGDIIIGTNASNVLKFWDQAYELWCWRLLTQNLFSGEEMGKK